MTPERRLFVYTTLTRANMDSSTRRGGVGESIRPTHMLLRRHHRELVNFKVSSTSCHYFVVYKSLITLCKS